jgi:3-dehydroquinate synthase
VAVQRVWLVGLSGAGKSTVARLAAERLGWDFLDSDVELASTAGKSIPDLFEAEGEARFRERERDVIARLGAVAHAVIATGGGAPISEACRTVMANGMVIWLDVTPEQAARRLAQAPASDERPLLAGDARSRLNALFEQRHALYEQSDHSIAVDYYTPAQVGDRIAHLVEEAARSGWAPVAGRFVTPVPAAQPAYAVAARVTTPGASYPVVVSEGALGQLGAICRDVGLKGRAFVLVDAGLVDLYRDPAEYSLARGGYASLSFAIPAGEQHKTLATVQRIYDWLIEAKVERSDFVVCLGGGVITDMGGFAAATCLRGIPFVHVPTTLLGMVDAAVGGKTGVDHPRGKNLIGAFAQPSAVVCDPMVLATLPERELRAGWAEVIKHGFILDEPLVTELERVAGNPGALRSAALIARSVAIKAAVVSEDEREADRRTLLNYGHTVGHAIEAVTGYGRYLHGEAVAIGMRAAGLISVELGLLGADEFARQQRLVRACGLPESAPGLSADVVLAATLGDKKVQGGKLRWVLLEGMGNAIIRGDVPEGVVRRAVEAVLV